MSRFGVVGDGWIRGLGVMTYESGGFAEWGYGCCMGWQVLVGGLVTTDGQWRVNGGGGKGG